MTEKIVQAFQELADSVVATLPKVAVGIVLVIAALVVTALTLRAAEDGNEAWKIVDCPYFRMERLLVRDPCPVEMSGRSCHVLFPVAGEAVT